MPAVPPAQSRGRAPTPPGFMQAILPCCGEWPIALWSCPTAHVHRAQGSTRPRHWPSGLSRAPYQVPSSSHLESSFSERSYELLFYFILFCVMLCYILCNWNVAFPAIFTFVFESWSCAEVPALFLQGAQQNSISTISSLFQVAFPLLPIFTWSHLWKQGVPQHWQCFTIRTGSNLLNSCMK